MASRKPIMKMPEFLIFIKIFVIGFFGAEVFRIAFYLGTSYAKTLSEVTISVKAVVIFAVVTLCLIYAAKRDAYMLFMRVGRSYRIDLLTAGIIGIWSNDLAAPWLAKLHSTLKSADPYWALVILILLCVALVSPLFQLFLSRRIKDESQLRFLEDKEIGQENNDLLTNEEQAKSFAETVLASGAHPGLVFGVDGPWGIGKTSFINLAEHYWKQAADKVIVCRFEPLRYASEPDLADRLIRDLSAAIQSEVFAPEFRPVASRYSRLIKGKADISFLGFKISLEPSQETIDELLDDINEVLRRIGRRVIIVIDDLDRLETKTVNNVLFATRRTLKLAQATYILCYDTEILVGNEEGSRAREFLEKFVTIKLSLFVDSSKIRDFLRGDWKKERAKFGLVPSDTMIKLSAVLTELAEILDGNLAANYLPLVGDLRKVKRFINAILMMQIEKTDLGRTDFNKRDLINLILLHLHYPGVFRRIYAEETEGRSGTFSVQSEYDKQDFINASGFSSLENEVPRNAYFLLKQLFDVKTLELGDKRSVEESVRRSRACFNSYEFRNLEAYLKLIVRFIAPEPQQTFVLYQSAVEQVRNGSSIDSTLQSLDFDLSKGEHAHDQFWRILVNQSYDFTSTQAESAINTLIDYLPRYSAFGTNDRGLRPRSIYSLLILLDQAGWGRTSGRRLANTTANVVEIAWRIFGENNYSGVGILERLANPDRGVLGWNDLMIFRLQCSEDRRGQLHNLSRALIAHHDINAKTEGLVSQLALIGMRKLSQVVFAMFKHTYIDSQRNFFTEVNDVPAEAFLGSAFAPQLNEALRDPQSEPIDNTIAQRISSARNGIKSFVIYQLSNSLPPNGSGVGCGYYDEEGENDEGNIAKLMNRYIFDFCFNPEIKEQNALLFLDHCLMHLTPPFYSGREDGYIATKDGITGGLDIKEMGHYWHRHRERILGLDLHTSDRKVFTSSYIAFYKDELNGVFVVLDELAKLSTTA